MRKFLIRLQLWTRLKRSKRELRRVRSVLASIKTEHEKELRDTRHHYEVQLAEARLKIEALSLAIADRTLQAFQLMPVSHTVANLKEEAKELVDPAYKPPLPDPEDMLSDDEHDFFLDAKESFFQDGERRGLSLADINKRWETEGKASAISNAQFYVQ